jgi:UDP-N-acetylmuramate--alanine ligase
MQGSVRKVQNFLSQPKASKTIPLDIGIIHFVGIGGIGMSGIAEILNNLGYQVAGSDVAESPNVDRLRKLGIDVKIGHNPENVESVAVVVKSTAVPMTNPEIATARENGIPVVRRSEMLAELTKLKNTVAVAGTHGKTTTTSLISRMFESANLDPTVINGGIINAYGTNARLGEGDWLITEADESDATFIKIPATIGVVTNIEPEHLDFYGSFDELRKAFQTFLENLPFYGCAVLCIDDMEVKNLITKTNDRRLVTYGTNEEADVRSINIRNEVDGSTFDVELSERIAGEKKTLKDISLPMPGFHNVQNSLAAIAIGLELKFEEETIINGFKNFSGVKRRFTKTGEVNGVTIIDDYGHHPTEIGATLKTAKDIVADDGKIIAVVQPHRYSRLKSLFKEFSECFSNADKVIVSNVYEAGESPIAGANRDSLIDALRTNGVDAIPLDDPDQLASIISDLANKGDMVVCLGAGSVTKWANTLPQQLIEK